MACLIKAPEGSGKGCVSFTTAERDDLINRHANLRDTVAAMKARYFVGLHHNWHDHDFVYDPLFDFSMAGEGDLIARGGAEFPRVSIDACNFAPEGFDARRGAEKFWDVINVSRAVFFKGIPEFLAAIRAIYDRGRLIRVLYLCPVPPPDASGTTIHGIRARYEALFSPDERQRFTLITMEWDYPFPLDLETLAFFYQSSRVYVHPAPEERRCRTAGYAWAAELPVVARANVASILPEPYRREPFWFPFEKADEMADAILAAVDHSMASSEPDASWSAASNEFRTSQSALRLSQWLDTFARSREQQVSVCPINPSRLDIRLGRHHEISFGPNRVQQNLLNFCEDLCELSDADLAKFSLTSDPEIEMAQRSGARTNAAERPVIAEKPKAYAANFLSRIFARSRTGA